MHLQTVETNEAELVCLACGLVLDKCYSQAGTLIVDEMEDYFLQDELGEIFARGHLPQGLVYNVIRNYNSYKEGFLKSFSKLALLCYATFSELTKNGIPRSPVELASYFNVSPHEIWKLQKKMEYPEALEAAQMISRFMCELQIPYQYLEAISDLVKEIEKFSCAKPETVAAAAIFKVSVRDKLNLKLSDISHACGTSQPSIRSLYKKL